MVLDRITPPDISDFGKINLPDPRYIRTSLGNDLFIFFSETKKVLKLDIVIQSDLFYDLSAEELLLIPKMLLLGTKSKSAEELNEQIEYLGAFTQYGIMPDGFVFSLYCQTEHFEKAYSLFLETIMDPSFDSKELVELKEREISGLLISLKKTKTVARRAFKQGFFGLSNPYGRIVSEEGIKKVEAEVLKKKYFSLLEGSKFSFLGSGYISDDEISCIEKESFMKSVEYKITTDRFSLKNTGLHEYKPWKESVQSSIYMGIAIPDFNHPDFYSVSFINTILGGYFGSRLMKNIREEKGLTYGINSVVTKMKFSCQSLIVSDVLKDKRTEALDEIYKEIGNLNMLEWDEINLVRNYLLGSFQSDISSSFSLSELYSKVFLVGSDFNYYKNWIAYLQNMNPDIFKNIAYKYFKPEKYTEIMVG